MLRFFQRIFSPTKTSIPNQDPVSNNVAIDQSGGIEKRIDFLNLIMIGVIVALFIGFAGAFVAVGTLVYTACIDRITTYQQLMDQVQAQNDKIDILMQERSSQNNPITPTSTTSKP
jgi:hypothetical protein